MAKKIKVQFKVNLSAGEATPAPPVGPALGQHGVPIMDFIKAYNAKTADQKGSVIPAVITVYQDGSYDFITKLPPVADMIKKTLGIDKGSGEPNKTKVGKLSQSQLESIANDKMKDLNARDIQSAKKIVAGTAQSMGITIENA